MTINEKRVSDNRHFWTCLKVESKEQLIIDGASTCKVLCCSGSPHKHRNEIEGPIEKYPKRLVKRVVLFKPTQIVICVLFVIYLGFSIWGATGFKEGLDIRDLVGSDSYYYDFYDTDQTSFSQSLTVSLTIQNVVDYKLPSTVGQINSLVSNVRNDSQVLDDFLLSWVHSYRSSIAYNDSSDAVFPQIQHRHKYQEFVMFGGQSARIAQVEMFSLMTSLLTQHQIQ
jgi:predicted RND superfamily exporter protein